MRRYKRSLRLAIVCVMVMELIPVLPTAAQGLGPPAKQCATQNVPEKGGPVTVCLSVDHTHVPEGTTETVSATSTAPDGDHLVLKDQTAAEEHPGTVTGPNYCTNSSSCSDRVSITNGQVDYPDHPQGGPFSTSTNTHIFQAVWAWSYGERTTVRPPTISVTWEGAASGVTPPANPGNGGQRAPSVRLSLDSPQPAGTKVTANGTGFNPGEQGQIQWYWSPGEPGGGRISILATYTADSNGSFSVPFTIPKDAPPGRYLVVYQSRNNLNQPFDVSSQSEGTQPGTGTPKVPHFLTLPFPSDPAMKIQQGWTSAFEPNHHAIDYIKGTLDESRDWQSFPVLAAADGDAACGALASDRSSKCVKGEGNRVLITHHVNGQKYYTYYGHLKSIASKILIGNRDTPITIHRGQVIGTAGDTGTNPGWVHLHFGLTTPNFGWIGPYDISSTRNKYPDPNGTDGLRSGSNNYWTTNPPSSP